MSNNETMVIQQQQAAPLTVNDVIKQVTLIQEVMQKAMKDGEHFGLIPGCGDKKVLFKAGAEKLCLTFRMAPKFVIEETNLPNGHKEYRIVCELYSIGSGALLGSGVGAGSTMESKYRYRRTSDYEVLDEPIPNDAKERKTEYAKRGLGMKKIDGVWSWVKFKEGEKSENPDPADCHNTVLKMAKKRAQVDAILTATAASDLFTQDLEELRQDAAEEPDAPKQGFEHAKSVNERPADSARNQAASPQERPPRGPARTEFKTISKPQAKRLYAIGTNTGGISGDELNRLMGQRYPYIVDGEGHTHLEQLAPMDYDAACKWAETGCQSEQAGDAQEPPQQSDDNIPF